jgi:uncharacterized membrane protein
MKDIIEHVEVKRPVDVVYNQYTQFEEFPRFMEDVEAIRQLDPTHLRWTMNIAGAQREFDTEITEQIPEKRIAWKSLDGPKQAGVVTFHRISDTLTRVTLQMSYEPEGLTENVGDALGIVQSRARRDLENFKDFIEQRGRETGAWRGKVPAPDERGS